MTLNGRGAPKVGRFKRCDWGGCYRRARGMTIGITSQGNREEGSFCTPHGEQTVQVMVEAGEHGMWGFYADDVPVPVPEPTPLALAQEADPGDDGELSHIKAMLADADTIGEAIAQALHALDKERFTDLYNAMWLMHRRLSAAERLLTDNGMFSAELDAMLVVAPFANGRIAGLTANPPKKAKARNGKH